MTTGNMARYCTTNPTVETGFIIHLARASARRAQVDHLREVLPFEADVIDAIDGRVQTAEMGERYQRSIHRPGYPFELRPAEVATFLSHRACWKKIVEHNLSAAIILEDDVTLSQPQFGAALDTCLEHIQDGDLVRFPTKTRERARVTLSDRPRNALYEPKAIGLGMQCQVVTQGAAARLLAKTETFDRPVDTFLQMRWVHGVRVLTVVPSGVGEASADLGGSLIGMHMSLREKVLREIHRPIYRFKLATMSKTRGAQA